MPSDLRLDKAIYFTAIDGVASFPEVMHAIRAAIADPSATPSTVGRAVERDVAFASRLLRIVNSPVVGLIRPCASVGHAVSLVGLGRIGMQAEATASRAAIDQCSAVAPEMSSRAATEAAVARSLAFLVGASPEHAYTAALLANVGAVAIVATQPQWCAPADIPLTEERERLGFDHAELGAEVLERWNLPAPIPEVVRLHHDLEAARDRGFEIARLVALVQAAEHLAPRLCQKEEPSDDEWEDLADHPSFDVLDLDWRRLAEHWIAFRADIAHEADARVSGIPMAAPSEPPPAPVPRPERRRTPPRRPFVLAMTVAVLVPAAVAFALHHYSGALEVLL